MCFCDPEINTPFCSSSKCQHEKARIEFIGVDEGSIVKNKGSGQAYVITDKIKGGFVAVRTITITNFIEWRVIKKWKEEKFLRENRKWKWQVKASVTSVFLHSKGFQKQSVNVKFAEMK